MAYTGVLRQTRTVRAIREAAHFTIQRGVIQRLIVKKRGGALHILNGIAWVSYRGMDYILQGGDELPFTKAGELAVISAERGPVTYEVVMQA